MKLTFLSDKDISLLRRWYSYYRMETTKIYKGDADLAKKLFNEDVAPEDILTEEDFK